MAFLTSMRTLKTKLPSILSRTCLLHSHATKKSRLVGNVFSYRAIERGYGNNDSLKWVEGDAEKLGFEDNSMDGYTIAFGIRNVTHIEKELAEAYRVLKRGGRFLCLELSHVDIPVFKDFYDYYSFSVIPAVGEMVTGDRESYQYLVESVRKFPNQEKYAGLIADAGFQKVQYENLVGGVVAIHSGLKI
ncbi:2-methoxy-6-polyprenyl-1,4-benzoquinol methylase [Ranunculus cassubicifolius]